MHTLLLQSLLLPDLVAAAVAAAAAETATRLGAACSSGELVRLSLPLDGTMYDGSSSTVSLSALGSSDIRFTSESMRL